MGLAYKQQGWAYIKLIKQNYFSQEFFGSDTLYNKSFLK